jgi:hypothetical protein
MPPPATREELVAALKHAHDRYESLEARHTRILRENAQLRRQLGIGPDTEILRRPTDKNSEHA